MPASTSEMASPLEKALTRGAPQLKLERIESVERFTSGLSSQSYCISAVTADGPIRWVMRVEPEFGVIPPYDIGREFRLIEAAGRDGLPVPGVLHLEEDASFIGARFMLMSYVEGEVFRSMDARLEADPALMASVQEKFVEMLVRVHAVPQEVLPAFKDGREAARAEITVCRRRLNETALLPSPIFRHALDILDQYAPEAERLVLLHGDYRLPNLKWHEGEISGVLDWELARVGDPLSDLAFTQTIGKGPCSIEGDLAVRYGELAGIEIDDRRLLYYRLLEMVKGSIIGMAGTYDLAHGGDDLRLLSVAMIAAAGQAMMGSLEAQLEQFLEA